MKCLCRIRAFVSTNSIPQGQKSEKMIFWTHFAYGVAVSLGDSKSFPEGLTAGAPKLCDARRNGESFVRFVAKAAILRTKLGIGFRAGLVSLSAAQG
jgi:hypothetical protein